MGEEYTRNPQRRETEREVVRRESCDEPQRACDSRGEIRGSVCNSCDPCDRPCGDSCREDDWDWGSWLPILLIILLLCGGGGVFGGGRDDCCDGGFGNNGSGWLIILIVIFLFCSNRDNGRGGFLGGLF